MADTSIKELQAETSRLKKEMQDLLKEAGGDALARAAIKAKPEYKALIVQIKEVNSQVLEIKNTTKDYTDRLIQQQSSAKKLTGIYTQLGKLDLKRVEKQAGALKMDADKVKQFEKISDLNQQLAQLSAEDSISKQLIQKEIQNELKDLEGSRGIHSHIVKNLKQQYDFANNISSLTEGQKEQLQAQVEVYEKIKKSIGGIFDTLSILTSGPAGFFGTALIGAGFAADKLGKNIRNFGGFIDSAQFSALGLSFIFDDAEETAKSLSKEFGGLKDVTLSTQLNTNLMATNMGISGNEAASIVGSFARINDGSASTAMDMAATTKEMAKAAGVPVDSVMKDVAGSAQAFAEYGKDGGLNIAKAAVSAAKLGVGMDSLTKVTDSLLDFETSINQELELGAMLGKNINLDRARALAYEGNIGGAVKETLQSLGGIEEFNKMDIFQKRKAAELLGLSVDEFQKMAANSDKLNDDGTVQVSTFNAITEAITASATASGGFLKTMGGLVLGAAQMGGSFAQMGMDVKGMAGGALDKVKGLFGGAKVAPTAPSIPGASPSIAATPKPGVTPPQTQAGPADQANKMSKIKSGDLIKGAVALVILAAALFIAAKAFQEFGEVTWESVGMGLVALAGLAGIAFILSKASGAMMQGALAVAVLGAALIPFAFAMSLIENLKIDAVLAAAAGLVMFGLAAAGIGMILPLILAGSVGIAALGVSMMLFGAGLVLVSAGMGAISAVIPFVTEQISALSTINFLPILGLAGALTVLSIALAAVAATGMLALPALLALGLIAGGAAAVMGGGEGEGSGDRTGELIDEIKGLRADLIAGKIAVNIDGQKVTSNVGKVVARNSSNSYAKV